MINKIVAENFLSWKSLSFEVKSGITLVDGWNVDDQTSEGSGKSAILNAITWCAYGKLPKDTKIDDVIKHGTKSCRVETILDNRWMIYRTRKPNDIGVVDLENPENIIKGKDAKETQQIIEDRFMKMSFETFCQSVYFAQNNDKKFISANQDERGKILSEIQDLNVFDRARKETMALIKQEESGLISLKHNLEVKRSRAELIDEKLQNIQNMVKVQEDQKARNLQAIEQEIRSANTQMEQSLQLVTACELELNKLYQELQPTDPVQSLQELIEICIGERETLKIQKNQIDDTKRTIDRKKLEGQRYGKEFNKLKGDLIKLGEFIANPTKDCPTCGSTLEKCDTSHAEQQCSDINIRLNEITVTLTELAQEINIEVPTTEELDKSISEKDQSINEWRRQISHIQNLEREISLKNNSAQNARLKAEQLKEHLENGLANKYVLERNRPIEIDHEAQIQLLGEKDSNSEEIQQLKELIINKDKTVNRLHSLKDGFKEIKSYVFNSVLNEINSRIDQYLHNLFEVPVSLKFINDNMKIDTTSSINGNSQGLGLMSGGQFRRFSLATDLALSDVVKSRKGNSTNLLILDEYFKDLSEQSMEKCLQILEKRNQPVILIEHNSIFKNIVNETFFVKYEKGTSYVET